MIRDHLLEAMTMAIMSFYKSSRVKIKQLEAALSIFICIPLGCFTLEQEC